MTRTARLGWGLLAAYGLVSAVRDRLARAAWHPPDAGPEPDVVVLQPILSGDPLLREQLAANLENHPEARFRWLVDEADVEGCLVADELAAGAPDRVEVRGYGPAPERTNPKVYKLAQAVDSSDGMLAVLDDDTVLPPGTLARAATALRDGDLVTGVPYYVPQGTIWSRLVAAFVNGSSLLTYLPVARVTPPVTVNGMFYATTREALDRAGGFGAIEDRVCDDHEIALAYRRAGLRVVQAALPHPLRTTVPGAGTYLRLMRRWFVFATRLLQREPSAALAALVVAPAVLPGAALTCAAASRRPRLAVAVVAGVAAKAVATAGLRRDLLGVPTTPVDAALEVVSDLTVPLHTAAALAAGGRIVWRGRHMVVAPDGRLRL